MASSAAFANPSAAQVKRGEQLVLSHGCADCHTPMKMGRNGPERDESRGLSGHPQELVMPPAPKLPEGPWNMVGAATTTAYAGPWGVSYAINLTSDVETGIGGWREQDFVQSIKLGKHRGVGRPVMPPMPWPAYKHLSDADLTAMFAYLKSTPPIRNRAPAYQPPQSK